MQPAEADIGGALRQRDGADPLALRIEHRHAVDVRTGAPAAPQIAINIAAIAVRIGTRLAGHEDADIGELGALLHHVSHPNDARGRKVVDQINLLLVGREGKPIGPQALRHHGASSGFDIETVVIVRQLRLGPDAFVIARNPGRRIGEPDRVVGLDHHIVGRVERLAVELVDQDRDGAIVLGARDPPSAVLAGDQAALAVAGVAVGVVGGLAVDAHPPGLLVPAHDAVVGNVAPQQAARIAHPDRPLAPAHAGGEPLHPGIVDAIFGEARIENLDRRVGIAFARLPAPEGLGREGGGGGDRRARAEHVSSCHLHGVSPWFVTTSRGRAGRILCRNARRAGRQNPPYDTTAAS